MYRPHTTCRACGSSSPALAEGIKANPASSELVQVMDLGIQPLANDFCQGNEERAGYAPLEVMLCPRCSLAQLSVTVRPDILYSKYAYQTSQSQTMLKHFESLWEALNPESRALKVIEIGSNDGFFLDFWKKHHDQPAAVMGIDPAANLVRIARDRGIPTLEGLFDRETAEAAAQAIPEPDLIVARHVFCHVENWQEFAKNLAMLCAKNTTIAIEVPFVPDMLQKGSFDQVYHEHLSYLSLSSMVALLHGSPLYLHKVIRFPVHGGVVLMLLRRLDWGQGPDPSVAQELAAERCGVVEWKAFAEKAKDQIATLSEMVRDLSKTKRVCGYGASAKSTVWINACHFTKREILYVMDSTATKVYRSVPGTSIPVVNEGTHMFDACDYCVLFAWNYASEIIEREKQYLALGGKFILPIPAIKVIGK